MSDRRKSDESRQPDRQSWEISRKTVIGGKRKTRSAGRMKTKKTKQTKEKKQRADFGPGSIQICGVKMPISRSAGLHNLHKLVHLHNVIRCSISFDIDQTLCLHHVRGIPALAN